MSNKVISVIIPVYNSAKTIGECLSSVLAQDYQNLEVLLVNDGSTDNLDEVIKPWQDKIKLFSQENKGAPSARNFGFRESKGEYVIFCDADIIMKPNFLSKMHDALVENPDAAYAYSSFKFGWKKFKSFPYSEERLKEMPFIHTTSLIRREWFPGFDEKFKKFQDWDLWLTIAEKGGSGIGLDEFLFTVKSGGTMSNWLPSFVYDLSFFHGLKVEKYREWEKIIKSKHKITAHSELDGGSLEIK